MKHYVANKRDGKCEDAADDKICILIQGANSNTPSYCNLADGFCSFLVIVFKMGGKNWSIKLLIKVKRN